MLSFLFILLDQFVLNFNNTNNNNNNNNEKNTQKNKLNYLDALIHTWLWVMSYNPITFDLHFILVT